jgi:hypothetical protein
MGREGSEMKRDSEWVCVTKGSPEGMLAAEMLPSHLQVLDGHRHGWQPTNQQLANLI